MKKHNRLSSCMLRRTTGCEVHMSVAVSCVGVAGGSLAGDPPGLGTTPLGPLVQGGYWGLENTNRLSESRDFSVAIDFNVHQSGTDSLAREDPTMFWGLVQVRESHLAWQSRSDVILAVSEGCQLLSRTGCKSTMNPASVTTFFRLRNFTWGVYF